MMTVGGSLWESLADLAVTQLPLFVVLACAMLLALIRRRRHPKASLLLCAGFALIAIDYATTAVGAYYTVTANVLGAMRANPSGSDIAMRVANLLSSTVAAFAFALIAMAVFVERVRPYADVPPEARRYG
ncbi:MAG: hypothetical protein U0746_09565 [Gemmataceae bacterium]